MAVSTLSFLLLLLLPILPLAVFAQAQGKIALNSYLTADDRNLTWKSLSGDFAFGFQRIVSDGFLLAIWFDKIPEKTVIWFANGDNLAPTGSKVELTRDGVLVLTDLNGEQIWLSRSVTGVQHASMQDNGNFVLANDTSSALWGTFSVPSDTILPTQVLDKGTPLISRYSASNFSQGRFKFHLQADGNLALHTLPQYDDDAYWVSNTIGTGQQVIFNQTGRIYLVAVNGSLLNSLTTGMFSSTDFYQRAVLNYDGVFRQYVYPRNNSLNLGYAKNWTSVPSFVPSNICTTMNQYLGPGVCGWNSYCSLGSDQRPKCECPQGYSYLDPSNQMNGCKPDFLPQSCNEDERDIFTFISMDNVDWRRNDYERYDNSDENFCRQICMSDCLCDVAIFHQGMCLKKRMPLSNGMIDVQTGGKALIKVRINSSGSSVNPLGCPKRRKDNRLLIIIGSVILSSSGALNLILIILSCLIWFRYFRGKNAVAGAHTGNKFSGLQSFTYKEIREATTDFKDELGRGAFGVVYKGVLESKDIIPIAIKAFDKISADGDREFTTEVNTIGQTNHRNLAKLISFCSEGKNRILVYEFMPNGSLADFLFGGSRPRWLKRIDIACGVARGLLYLHEECSMQIIHCDIKPQNVLLDASLMAKISDFGLAKLLLIDQTRTVTAVRGTKGYLAPEWFRNMPISAKVDVYSFGVMLLELICCRKNCEFELENSDQMILSDWAYDCFHNDKLELIVEGDEETLGDMRRVRRFVMIAMWCIQEEPSMRPSMKKVTQMLEGAVEVSIPPGPSSFIGSVQ